VAAILIGSQYGLVVIAALMTFEVIVYALALARMGRQMLGLSPTRLYRSCAGDYLIGLLVALSAGATGQVVLAAGLPRAAELVLWLLCGTLAGVAAWIVGVRWFNQPLASELSLIFSRIRREAGLLIGRGRE